MDAQSINVPATASRVAQAVLLDPAGKQPVTPCRGTVNLTIRLLDTDNHSHIGNTLRNRLWLIGIAPRL
jgi:hypothetical protein